MRVRGALSNDTSASSARFSRRFATKLSSSREDSTLAYDAADEERRRSLIELGEHSPSLLSTLDFL